MKPKLSKHRDYERRVNFHVFGFVVYVVFTEDIARSVNARYPDIDMQPTFDAIHCREKGNPYSHIFLRLGHCRPGTVAHESWHAIRYLLENWVGSNLDNETVAYHLGYLVDCAMSFRNDLIDAGLGVKSSSEKEVPRDNSQGITSGVQGMLSRFETAGQTGQAGEESLPQEIQRTSLGGRCCP